MENQITVVTDERAAADRDEVERLAEAVRREEARDHGHHGGRLSNRTFCTEPEPSIG